MTKHVTLTLALISLTTACQSISKLDDIQFVADASNRTDSSGSGFDAALLDQDGGATLAATKYDCLVREDADCDLVRQCGCDSDVAQCEAVGDLARAKCVLRSPNPKPAWAACNQPSQCPAGQGCDRGTCRPYCHDDEDCAGDSCVPARQANGELSNDVSVCWKRCQIGESSDCAEGTSCRSVRTPFTNIGTYCVAPLLDCPSVEDGICDEVSENGPPLCASNTDVKDCTCKPPVPEAKCDPFAQCGCALNQTCLILYSSERQLTVTCENAGSAGFDSPCATNSDCAVGLSCNALSHRCGKYCSTDSDCGAGACAPLPEFDRRGRCINACDKQDPEPCGEGEHCIQIDTNRVIFQEGFVHKSGSFCHAGVIPASSCPKDGICDDPSGTGLCEAGADRADCCPAFTPDGKCNPVRQCGCEDQPGTQCQVIDSNNETACLPTGVLPEGSICSSALQQCESGTFCIENACHRYCNDRRECQSNGAQCIHLPDASGKAAPYGACIAECTPGADECPAGHTCSGVADGTIGICHLPSGCPSQKRSNGVCDDTRPGGTHECALGTDPDCCKLETPEAECSLTEQCGCELKPGTRCVLGADGNPTCQLATSQALGSNCPDSDATCCRYDVPGSECNPILQCGCESKPGTQCQTLGDSPVAACYPVGKLAPNAICTSELGQCPPRYRCTTGYDHTCRAYCRTRNDCNTLSVCVKPDEAPEAIGFCVSLCDSTAAIPCPSPMRCAVQDDVGLCLVPFNPCPLTDNGLCDDTRDGGTGVCEYGSDPECDTP